MKIKIKAKPNSRAIKIVPYQDGLLVFLTATAHEGKANKQLVEVLAKYYQLKPNQIIITSGLVSPIKTVGFLNSQKISRLSDCNWRRRD